MLLLAYKNTSFIQDHQEPGGKCSLIKVLLQMRQIYHLIGISAKCEEILDDTDTTGLHLFLSSFLEDRTVDENGRRVAKSPKSPYSSSA